MLEELHGKTIFILRLVSMESALYWSRKLVAKGTITRMEFSNLFRELMALPIWKTLKWKTHSKFWLPTKIRLFCIKSLEFGDQKPQKTCIFWTFENDETVPNFIKRKGEKRKQRAKDPKSRQANSPKERCHKQVRNPLSTKTSISRFMKHSN
jgi:hypothetical protein